MLPVGVDQGSAPAVGERVPAKSYDELRCLDLPAMKLWVVVLTQQSEAVIAVGRHRTNQAKMI
ncbi:MAG: hypothetical protein ABGZ17_17170 [Planctomycetaceae bacterium]